MRHKGAKSKGQGTKPSLTRNKQPISKTMASLFTPVNADSELRPADRFYSTDGMTITMPRVGRLEAWKSTSKKATMTKE